MQTIIDVLPFSRLLLAVLLHFVWQATLIVSLVAILRSLIHPRYFQIRYLLSVLGLFAVLAAPLVTIGYYVFSTEAMMALNPPVAEFATHFVTVEYQNSTSLFEAQFQTVFSWFDNNRSFWLSGWLTGFLVLLVRLCLGLAHCLRLRRSQQPLPANLAHLADRLKNKLHITHNVVVASSREITQAVATGIIKPVVLIPAAWVSQLPVSAIEAVLAHELAHIKRWDLWVNLLQRFTETMFFFHPLVWWLSRTISSEREVCCDQFAIQVTGQPMRYVETLAHVAGSKTRDEFELQFGNAFIGGKNMNILRRAKMILEPASLDAQSPLRTLTLIVCVGLVIGYGSYAYCTMPNPVMASIQDPDQDHDHHADHDVDVHQHQSHSDHDGNVELVVVQEHDGHDGDDQKAWLRHLAQLLHGAEAGQVDHQEFARKLRQLADHLDGPNNHAHEDPAAHRHAKLHQHGDHVVDVQVIGHGGHPKHQRIKVVPKRAGRTIRHKAGESIQRIIEVTPEIHDDIIRVNPKIIKKPHSHVGDRKQIVVRVDENDPRHKIWVEEIHGAHDPDAHEHSAHEHSEHERKIHERHANELHFGRAQTSDDDLGRAIRELKNEVQQLRRELHQLRSSQQSSSDENVRFESKVRRAKDPHGNVFTFRDKSSDRKGPKASDTVKNTWIMADPDSKEQKKNVIILTPDSDNKGRFFFESKTKPKGNEKSHPKKFRWFNKDDIEK